MHPTSLEEMRRIVREDFAHAHGEPWTVLDVGSMSVNRTFPRTYREVMPPAWRYAGCDIAPGPNVDFLMAGPYAIQRGPGDYHLVISGQVLEHVPNPFRLTAEMARMLRPGGTLILTAPWKWAIHRHPLDCWRILPDGMRALFKEADLRPAKTYLVENDCWGVAHKPGGRRIDLARDNCSNSDEEGCSRKSVEGVWDYGRRIR